MTLLGGGSNHIGVEGLRIAADCLAAFIDSLGLERPHVLELSFGGGLALELYRRKPALPRTLVLASAYAGWAGSLPPQMVAGRLESCLREAELPPDRFVPGWLPGLLTDAAPPELAEEVMAIMSEFHPVGHLFVAEELHQQIPASTLSVMPGVGHLSNMEAPSRFNTEVRRFLHSQSS